MILKEIILYPLKTTALDQAIWEPQRERKPLIVKTQMESTNMW